MQRVLITGASGFIGRHCLPNLADTAREVHAVVQSSDVALPAGVIRHRTNLLDSAAAEQLVATVQPTHLLHLAWNATPGQFWTSLDNLRWVEASLALARAFIRCGGRRLVAAGSCAEYDWSPDSSSAVLLHETETPRSPWTLYGVAKNALHELLAAALEPAGVSFAWGRIFGLFGPGEHHRRLVASALESMLRRRPVQCTDGRQIRDLLHVYDVADAMTTLLASPLVGPVNIASGHGVPIGEVILRLAQCVGGEPEIQFGALPTAANEPARIVADVTRLKRELHWSPRFTLTEGLKHTAAWGRQRSRARPFAA